MSETQCRTFLQVDFWLDYVCQNVVPGSGLEAVLQSINDYLTFRSFLVGHATTAADVALWGQLQGELQQLVQECIMLLCPFSYHGSSAAMSSSYRAAGMKNASIQRPECGHTLGVLSPFLERAWISCACRVSCLDVEPEPWQKQRQDMQPAALTLPLVKS
eukprot:scaffold98133_cov20-Tisochrysis_lutea.AAC.3